MKVKTSDLTGAALDWAVAKCEGIKTDIPAWADKPWVRCTDESGVQFMCPRFSTDWSQAGPIIENSAIAVRPSRWIGPTLEVLMWEASPPMFDSERRKFGPTLLVAAMRCYVASKLGDEVDVPEELAA